MGCAGPESVVVVVAPAPEFAVGYTPGPWVTCTACPSPTPPPRPSPFSAVFPFPGVDTEETSGLGRVPGPDSPVPGTPGVPNRLAVVDDTDTLSPFKFVPFAPLFTLFTLPIVPGVPGPVNPTEAEAGVDDPGPGGTCFPTPGPIVIGDDNGNGNGTDNGETGLPGPFGVDARTRGEA